ncbi:MAG: Trp biosynthesis-associated membrane protein [Propioniciclava sp.]
MSASAPAIGPRPVIVVIAAASFGVAWTTWWNLTWTDALGDQSLGISGAQGSAGLAQILPVAALGGILATLTLRCVGRRVIAAMVAMLQLSMAALGWDARQPDAAALAASEPAAALATDPGATATLMPVLYAILGLLGLLACGWFGLRPAGQPPRTGPVSDPGSAKPADVPGVKEEGPADSVSAWKAMDKGLDPTVDERDGDRP